jgi:hypothetical protein
MDVDEMIRTSLPQQDSIVVTQTIGIKQKLDTNSDETEPEAKKVK